MKLNNNNNNIINMLLLHVFFDQANTLGYLLSFFLNLSFFPSTFIHSSNQCKKTSVTSSFSLTLKVLTSFLIDKETNLWSLGTS